jgi:hypothetical protein
MTKQWPGNWFNAKERSLKKLLEGGRRKEALGLLVEVYYQPGTSLSMKQRCVQELVACRVLTDPYLSIYVDYLRLSPGDEVAYEVRALLASVCKVDFDTPADHLVSADEVALRLRKHHLQDLPGCACAQGLHALLLASSPQQAMPLFEEALQADVTNHVAQIGLLLSLMAQEHYDQACSRAQQFEQPLHPQVEELALFLQTYRWLDDPTMPGPLPMSAQQLELLKLTRYSCLSEHVIALISARIHLLEGDAAQALALLRSATAQLDDQPRWHYAIAWACALTGDQEGIVSAWRAASGWSGRWTIACLLLDANPTLAHQYGVSDEYNDASALPPAYAPLFRRRTSPTVVPLPGQSAWQPGAGGIEEDMEALRCQLGAAFMQSDKSLPGHYIDMPVFKRLPLADQLFWHGLQLYLTDNREQACDQLDRAASSYGHRRAAFVLALLHLMRQRTEQANRLLDIACAGRNDPLAGLLQAYRQLCQGDLASAHASLSALADMGNLRASYALGNLWLLRARDAERQGQAAQQCYVEAASHFEKALLAQEQKPLIDSTECAYRAGYARLAALVKVQEPAGTDVVSNDDACEREWDEILPRLFSTISAQVAVACEDLLALFTMGLRPRKRICVALSWQIARACARAVQVEQAEKMLALLEYLADDDTLPDVRAVYQRCLALFARMRYQKADAERRPHVFQWIKAMAYEHRDNFALSLLAASLSLQHEDRSAALAVLAELRSVDSLEELLQADLRGLLTGDFQSADAPEPFQPVPTALCQVFYLLRAASSFARQQLSAGYAAFLVAAECEGNALPSVVDPRRIILSLCAAAQHEDELKPLLSQAFVAAIRLGDSEFSLSLLRVLVACGVLVDVDQRVAQLLTPTTDPEGRLGRECKQLYCYLASSAYKSADYLQAAHYLRLAASFERQAAEVEKLQGFALRLEGEAAVKRLLALPEVGGSPASYRPGRYLFLVQAIEEHPALREALLQNESAMAVQMQWAVLLRDSAREIAFLHGLAVIYRERVLREWAQVSQGRQQSDEKVLLLNILLWSLLLCTDEFWQHFTQIHSTRQDASGQVISVQRSNELMQQAVEELLSRHSIAARRYLREGRIQAARPHLHCLELCCSGTGALVEKLRTFGLTYGLTVDETRMQFLKEQAQKHSDQCFDEQLQDAYNTTVNSEVVKALPDGMRKYYDGGIRQLEPFLELLHELDDKKRIREVLLTCLEWYVEWFDDLWRQQMCEGLIDTAISAFALGEKFRALCTKSEGRIMSEQRAISSYLTYEALTEQIASAAPMLKEALEWNPYNNFARHCIDEVHYWQNIVEKVQPYIQEYSSKELRRITNRDPALLRRADEFPLVYLFLNRFPPPAYRKPRAWSKSKAASGRSAPALKPVQPADTRPSASQPAAVKIERPVTISTSPRQDAQLTKLLGAGKKALDEQRYDDAIDCLQRALQYTSDAGQRREIAQQLSYMYTMKGERLVSEIQRRKSEGSPYFALRRAALDDFKQALDYDASNKTAREHLKLLEM